ncbi:hypothetical protein F4780DRAFT_720682 [Xylariomycetidae sp. FL0641]|nr:hypothetical protein F4780DRAFT_720682 [Xylariomycetidae sp. FL0641]
MRGGSPAVRVQAEGDKQALTGDANEKTSDILEARCDYNRTISHDLPRSRALASAASVASLSALGPCSPCVHRPYVPWYAWARQGCSLASPHHLGYYSLYRRDQGDRVTLLLRSQRQRQRGPPCRQHAGRMDPFSTRAERTCLPLRRPLSASPETSCAEPSIPRWPMPTRHSRCWGFVVFSAGAETFSLSISEKQPRLGLENDRLQLSSPGGLLSLCWPPSRLPLLDLDFCLATSGLPISAPPSHLGQKSRAPHRASGCQSMPFDGIPDPGLAQPRQARPRTTWSRALVWPDDG